ncbi:TIGR03752 family integrating conjugative element protein [Comamonadaceae bacterium OH2545_COT-014]|nr:TIGR03752 family integrating conjugative element protein [Comamonadaceae bacterium OH2545_COT-014]
MASSSNRLIPVLGLAALVIVGTVLVKQCAGPATVKPGEDLKKVPTPELPRTAGADNDTPAETLATVAASNQQLRDQVQKIIENNQRLMEENRRLRGGRAGESASDGQPSAGAPGTSASAASAASGQGAGGDFAAFDSAMDTAASAADALMRGFPRPGAGSRAGARPGDATPAAADAQAGASLAAPAAGAQAPGVVRYGPVIPPMGYVAHVESERGHGRSQGVAMTRFVRTTQTEGLMVGGDAGGGPASQAHRQAMQAEAAARKPRDVPYFTIPENATLAGVTAMTSIIGRVPIDGRVTDPMQFKAVVGRDNLAANGFELPPDLAGMIVTGVAIGDMALSCSEGKIRSLTFVFNDGTIRTVSSRSRGGAIRTGGSGSGDGDLGFISDLHGNPCITGKFVTNAPRYLTDMIALGALNVAGQAYADAQRTVRNNADGSTTSSITGDVGSFALGQAVSGGASEVHKWMLQRLKNSFDAVITPSGRQLVVHLDKEIRIDKSPDARRLVHRQQGGRQIARGEHYGLE